MGADPCGQHPPYPGQAASDTSAAIVWRWPAPAGPRLGVTVVTPGPTGNTIAFRPVNATRANGGTRRREWRPEGGDGQPLPDRGQAAAGTCPRREARTNFMARPCDHRAA